MTITVRPVREEDAPAIASLLNSIIEAGIYTVMERHVTLEDQVAFIREVRTRGVYLAAVAEGSEEVVGIQSVEPFGARGGAFEHVGDVSTFVQLGLHGRGIGQRLGDATVSASRERGYRKLLASIRADNPQAVAFYRSLGFREIGTARAHARVRGAYLDEVLMERAI